VDARARRAVRTAAWINGVLVALMPVWWVAFRWAVDPSNPARVPEPLQLLPTVYLFAALGLLAGWRTHVHVQAVASGRSVRWWAVFEPAALGFAVTVFLFGNLLRVDAPRAVPYLVTYGTGVAVVGLAIGIILRLVAVTTIRLAGGHRLGNAEWPVQSQ
jgi:hypothetical protein